MLNIKSLIFYSLSPHSPPFPKGLLILLISKSYLGALSLKGHKNLITVSKLSPSPHNSLTKSSKQMIPSLPKLSSTILFVLMAALFPSTLPKHLL